MADNVTLPGTNAVIAAEELSSRKYQIVKVAHGADGSVALASATDPLPVKLFDAGSTTTIHRYLDTAGDGTGTKNAIGNYSGAVEEFYIEPASDEVMLIARMFVTIVDNSAVSVEKYGALTALSNGVEVKVVRGASTVLNDLTDGIPVTSNGLWAANCYDSTPDETGSGNNLYKVRWTFANSGEPIRLDGAQGDRLVVQLNDNLSGLVSHYFKVEGVFE